MENLLGLVTALLVLPLNVLVLIVDDGSPDGTGDLAGERARHNHELTVPHRSEKSGLASAYVQGFHFFLEGKMDVVG